MEKRSTSVGGDVVRGQRMIYGLSCIWIEGRGRERKLGCFPVMSVVLRGWEKLELGRVVDSSSNSDHPVLRGMGQDILNPSKGFSHRSKPSYALTSSPFYTL